MTGPEKTSQRANTVLVAVVLCVALVVFGVYFRRTHTGWSRSSVFFWTLPAKDSPEARAYLTRMAAEYESWLQTHGAIRLSSPEVADLIKKWGVGMPFTEKDPAKLRFGIWRLRLNDGSEVWPHPQLVTDASGVLRLDIVAPYQAQLFDYPHPFETALDRFNRELAGVKSREAVLNRAVKSSVIWVNDYISKNPPVRFEKIGAWEPPINPPE